MTRVLVTGARGFLGRQVVAELVAAGAEVHGVGRGDGGAPGVRWHAADLLADPGAVLAAAEPDVLVHLAWVTEHGAFWTAPENLDWLAASLTLFRAAPGAGVRRIVGAGTCAEYDWTSGAATLAETAPLAPATLYGAAKAALADVAGRWAAEAGIGFAWARLFLLYGPGEAPGRLVPSVARALAAGEVAEVGPGELRRDLLHTADAGRAIARLALADLEGPVNVASGEGVTIGEVVERLGAIAGHPELVRVGARPARPGDPPALVADTRRMRDELGVTPAVGLDEGLRAAYAEIASGA